MWPNFGVNNAVSSEVVLKVEKLLLCYEGHGCCIDGGGNVFGSAFGRMVGVFDMGYVIGGSGGG
jgi:hypothetical protein